MYSLLKPLLFGVDAELAHDVSMDLLQQFHGLLPNQQILKPVTVMGIEFPNAVGLAAGLDKNADYLDGLSRFGFGFIEVGSITPRPQPGNPQPRLFRLGSKQSIINRMGFNNKGVDYLVQQVEKRSGNYKLGINIGKNLTTPVDQALSDYELCLRKVYNAADYIAVNISSPNTPGLRALQNEDALESLLAGLRDARHELEDQFQVRRPMALKVAPDLDDRAIPGIAECLIRYEMDALIATNTTLDRSYVSGHRYAEEAGGCSGRAVRDVSRHILKQFHQVLGNDVPIISVGGIDSAEEAKLRLDSGASLVQLYSSLIYRGPGLVKEIASAL